MPKVPELPASVRSRIKPGDTLIVCNRGKKIHPEDEKALNEWIDMVKARNEKRRQRKVKKQ